MTISVYVINNPLEYTDPTGLQVASRPGRVYTNGSLFKIFDGGNIENGYTPFSGDLRYSLPDGYDYHVTANGWTNLGNTVLNRAAVNRILSSVPIGIPFGGRNDEVEPGTIEDFSVNTKDYVFSAVHSASKAIWNGVSDVAPDYGKVSFRVPLVVDVNLNPDREFRLYGGVDTPLGSYGSRTDFNLLDNSRPKSFGFRTPSASLGWFTNIGNERKEIGDAMSGANVSGQFPVFGPYGSMGGVSKSMPSDFSSLNSIMSSPTAIEFATPGAAGGGIGFSEQIPCSVCANAREYLRNWRWNPNNVNR